MGFREFIFGDSYTAKFIKGGVSTVGDILGSTLSYRSIVDHIVPYATGVRPYDVPTVIADIAILFVTGGAIATSADAIYDMIKGRRNNNIESE